MKTLLVVSLVLMMMFSFTACGNDETTQNPANGDQEVLTMATNAYFPPYEYYDGENIVC